MFDQILEMIKDHLGNNPTISNAIPAQDADAVHNEIASKVTDGLKNQAVAQGGVGGLLNSLSGNIASGNPVSSAIEGSLVSSLASKFGLPPSVTGAISAMLPGLLQKFAQKANDPNDHSVTPASISSSLFGTGGLGSLLGNL